MKTSTLKNQRSLLTGAAAVTAAVLAGLVFAAAASAAETTCSLSNGVLALNMASTSSGTMIQTAGGTIAINEGGPVTCAGGTPTTSNIDVIRVVDVADDPSTPTPGDGNSNLTVLEPATFGPGLTSTEAPGQNEIEIVVNMGAGTDDRLLVTEQAPRRTAWTAGSYGLDWNGDGDPDLVGMGSFDRVTLNGDTDNDLISAYGGNGTGAPLVGPRVVLEGEAGDDELFGSDGLDGISGGPGNDSLAGMGGDDNLNGGTGNNRFVGGAGSDYASFSTATTGVSVDLGLTGPQDTGDYVSSFAEIENVLGTNFADTLVGNGAANVLSGDNGDDTLDGRGGSDELIGYAGSDTVTYAAAPGAVTADLAARTGTQGADADKLREAENLIGSPFADTLAGDAAANRIVGGDGADAIDARGGADLVELRDGVGDQASCGDGADSVIADRLGIDLLAADCEAVDLQPEPAQPQGGDAPVVTPDQELRFVLGGSRLQRVLRQKAVRVRVRSPLEASTTTVSASGKRPRLRVRPVTAAVPAGSTRTLALRLTRNQLAAIRRALAAGRAPTLAVRAEARDAAGNRVVRTLRVRMRR